mgnify:CR=1 FL=1|jgi:hypothetical protein
MIATTTSSKFIFGLCMLPGVLGGLAATPQMGWNRYAFHILTRMLNNSISTHINYSLAGTHLKQISTKQ